MYYIIPKDDINVRIAVKHARVNNGVLLTYQIMYLKYFKLVDIII